MDLEPINMVNNNSMAGLGELGPLNQVPIPQINKPKIVLNEPGNLSGRELFAKMGIGLIIGGIIAGLLFVVMTFVGSMFTSAMTQQGAKGTLNPMISIILLFIGFLSTFIGNISVAGIYNLFYGKKYHEGGKTFGLLLLTNGLLFFILAPLYFIFGNQVESLFILLGFHTIFSIFVSACQIEFSANPNYSGSALMGNIIGFAGSFLVYSFLYQGVAANGANQTYLLVLIPSILGYSLIPFGAGLWEKIYYKLYEMGNNPFYLSGKEEEEEKGEEGQKNDDETNIEG